LLRKFYEKNIIYSLIINNDDERVGISARLFGNCYYNGNSRIENL